MFTIKHFLAVTLLLPPHSSTSAVNMAKWTEAVTLFLNELRYVISVKPKLFDGGGPAKREAATRQIQKYVDQGFLEVASGP